jgi:hypothetical protein
VPRIDFGAYEYAATLFIFEPAFWQTIHNVKSAALAAFYK